jgi:hypothetical protein
MSSHASNGRFTCTTRLKSNLRCGLPVRGEDGSLTRLRSSVPAPPTACCRVPTRHSLAGSSYASMDLAPSFPRVGIRCGYPNLDSVGACPDFLWDMLIDFSATSVPPRAAACSLCLSLLCYHLDPDSIGMTASPSIEISVGSTRILARYESICPVQVFHL